MERAPSEQKGGPFGRPALTFLVLALPALWVGWLIYQYGVDMPWGDQWDSTRLLLEKMRAGTLGFADFFAFHNEHRIFFPRLLTLGLAKLTHWNVRAELLMIWILVCVCSLNLWRVAQISGWRNSGVRHWLLLGTNVLLFSPLQWENLLWGFQIGFILPLATMTACLWVAPFAPAALRLSWPRWFFVLSALSPSRVGLLPGCSRHRFFSCGIERRQRAVRGSGG